MSKATLAVIAAVSAGAGAAATAAMYNLRSESNKPKTITTTSTTTTVTSPTTTTGLPPTQVFAAPAPIPSFPSTTTTTSALPAPVNPAGLFEYGFPGPVADVATRAALVSSFDRRLRNPHWVAEHITPASLASRDADRKHSVFLEDPAVPDKFRARLRDYARSGYDRGHQVPAADAKWSQQAMDETFFLSNMCPQVGEGFNRDYWAHFEDFCRRLTGKYPSVRVVTGPLYLPRKNDPSPTNPNGDGKWYVKYEVIGNPPSVAVPTHFYKVIFAEDGAVGGNVALGAFVLPNAAIPNDKPLTDFEVPLEAVERASGLEFATKLPVQRRRRLCADTSCSIIVKEYAQRQQAFGKGQARR